MRGPAKAIVVGVLRSGFLYRSAVGRALVMETGMIVLGLVVARALSGPTPLALAFALWGFYLVQSLFFLNGGVHERAVAEPAGDPFARARDRAFAVMD